MEIFIMDLISFSACDNVVVSLSFSPKELPSKVELIDRDGVKSLLNDKGYVINKLLRKRREAIQKAFGKALLEGRYLGSEGTIHYYERHGVIKAYDSNEVESINKIINNLIDGNYDAIMNAKDMAIIRKAMFWATEDDREATDFEKFRYQDLIDLVEVYAV